ncbi:ArnT family glycosyltransferase [Mucilaginibacter pedocola]|uniref:Glycosyltransferase RgtA/B/C/D-like domain-containing protein n=1 Tax=Mucilaginibacter pedocola TaxID=1792845 RepID=A0A1S9PB74_9SPHI|nr:glycosyltransferase family 39 protein [Mucilaginibacter pedocola]OOQ58224.1 hypothetical protein BC343_11310 [Mucilaginibacter pedocola]
MANTATHPAQSNKPIWYFIACWTALNLLQAYVLEIHGDEAYYWLYAQKPDWGYFYHPPMMAVFIKIGYTLFHNEFGARLVAVLTNSLALYLLWLIVKKYAVTAKWFILLVSCVLIIHVYGFTTTPDAPLFFFAVLFYYLYQKYTEEDSWLTALLIGIVVACLLYSKYHGVLLVGFTVLSNLKLFKRPSFYLAIVVGLICFTPHILWQAARNFPAVNYQLFERSSDKTYNISLTTEYLGGQLLLGGILLSWFLFYKAFRTKATDTFTRALIFNAIGTFGFFCVNTFFANVQPHYTLIGFIPLVTLALINLQRNNYHPKWLFSLTIVNIALILVLRISLVAGFPFVKKIIALRTYFGFREWAAKVHEKAGDAWMVMDDGFQNPSKYDFYNHTLKGFAYDSRYYGRTMFDIWPMEDSLQHKRIYVVSAGPLDGYKNDTIKTKDAGAWYGVWVDDARTYQKIAIDTKTQQVKLHPGQKVEFDLQITNPYGHDVNFTNLGYKHPVYLESCFFTGPTDIADVQPAGADFNNISLKPGATAAYHTSVVAPKEKRTYYLMFSIRTEPFRGSKNSRLIKFIVE